MTVPGSSHPHQGDPPGTPSEERFRPWTVTIIVDVSAPDEAEAVDAALYRIRNGGHFDVEAERA